MGIKFKYFSIRFGDGKRMKKSKFYNRSICGEEIPEGAMWFNQNNPDKVKVFKNGEWVETDPFKDLEERKIKK